jgi:hypothetical protein
VLSCIPTNLLSNGTLNVFPRHCDNPDSNGRLLTAILYLNPDWAAGDGGELQLTQTRLNGTDVTEKQLQRVVVIPPLMNRLLLFWSDRRCPHEVLPTLKHRYAITTWYFNAQVLLRTSRCAFLISKSFHFFSMCDTRPRNELTLCLQQATIWIGIES